jgi:hypothetical protein
MSYYVDELLSLRVPSKPCPAFTDNRAKLSRIDYATAEAAGFDMSQFSVAPSRYLRG